MEPSSSGTDGADVYIRDTTPKTGPWTVQNVLSPVFDANTPKGFQAHTVLVEVEDNPGVLNEVTGVIARRGYNIQSLAVGTSETPGFSRITTVLPGQRGGVSKLIKQLEKLVVVQQVQDLTDVPHVARELMLVKVRSHACAAAAVSLAACGSDVEVMKLRPRWAKPFDCCDAGEVYGSAKIRDQRCGGDHRRLCGVCDAADDDD